MSTFSDEDRDCIKTMTLTYLQREVVRRALARIKQLEDALPVLRDALCAATHDANDFNCGTQIRGPCPGCAGDRIRDAAVKLIEELQKQEPSDGMA